ncbi:hypothetical protein GW590_19150 [Rahnella sp. SAP-1]|uniref:Uncharacterized protein n=2 Tax=Rouxiella aceris TaxID=2703884 RepID=A0A848MPP3_9GAMM|nr:hypothetical protein [Rouxiella aceris]
MTTTFKDAYNTLKNHAQTLRSQQEPNIDDLLRIVEESVTAYKTCQLRIDAVEQALQKALSETNLEHSSDSEQINEKEGGSANNNSFAEDENDIPF